LINKVQVSCNVRRLGVLQRYWESSSAVLVPPMSTETLWVNFDDPVVDVREPGIGSVLSSYLVNTREGLDGDVSQNVVVDDFTVFGTSAKITFENISGSPLWVHDLVLYCRPGRVVDEIYVELQDDESVAKYGEQILAVENNYFSSE